MTTSATIKRTYLRYECADAFSVTCDSSSCSSQIVACSPDTDDTNNIVFSVCKSFCLGFHLRRGGNHPCIKIGHSSGSNLGTGNALNSDESTCVQVTNTATNTNDADIRIATGWADGSVRIFTIPREELLNKNSNKAVHSLLLPNSSQIALQEPLVLQGHRGSPVTFLAFDNTYKKGRLASGGSDGSVVIWDLLAETGLFRLLGHTKGPITHLSFLFLDNSFDGLASSSTDGLVKLWDLNGQCCTQTLTNHRSEVWSADTIAIQDEEDTKKTDTTTDTTSSTTRWRLVTGASDVQLRVWALRPPPRTSTNSKMLQLTPLPPPPADSMLVNDTPDTLDNDEVAIYMGSIHRQTNERVSLVQFHPSGKLLGVLAHGSKQVEIYSIRSVEESQKRRKRRLRRRREKKETTSTSANTTEGKQKKKKKGILDDESDDEKELDDIVVDDETKDDDAPVDSIKATDEFEFVGILTGSQKIKSFTFSTGLLERGTVARVVLALTTNALEIHTVSLYPTQGTTGIKRLSTLDMYGHPTGIRSISLSSDETMACTISKGAMKVWNVANRSCIRSLPLLSEENSSSKKRREVYGLCCAFLPGNAHVVIGFKEGNLQIVDFPSGDVVFDDPEAHGGAIWSLDVRNDGQALVTGSADHEVKFWDIVLEDSNSEINNGKPSLILSRVMKMNDDVVAVKYSYSYEPSKRLVAVSTLDSTVKVFFDDSLKFFLSLYGHKLPALAIDCSDDDTLIATAGADKSIKLWGLDFGDTHRTLYGHSDSITDLVFVRRTHNFFTSSKDKTIRYWDGDRFEQILLLSGHKAEVTTLALSKTGAFLLSAGMDRQVRVWERTKDIVFIEEEKERELEKLFDKVDGSQGESSLQRRIGITNNIDDEQDEINPSSTFEPQSEAAVRRSVLSIAGGDRIAEALELADQEIKDNLGKTSANQSSNRNPLLLGLDPPKYVLWVLRTIKSAELEQSLLTLPMSHTERLMHYLVVLLRRGIGVEICSNAAIFLIKVHQNQIVSNRSLGAPLRELRMLIKSRITQDRDMIGYNLAALRAIARISNERKPVTLIEEQNSNNIWAGMGLGSDIAAALERKKGNTKRRKV